MDRNGSRSHRLTEGESSMTAQELIKHVRDTMRVFCSEVQTDPAYWASEDMARRTLRVGARCGASIDSLIAAIHAMGPFYAKHGYVGRAFRRSITGFHFRAGLRTRLLIMPVCPRGEAN